MLTSLKEGGRGVCHMLTITYNDNDNAIAYNAIADTGRREVPDRPNMAGIFCKQSLIQSSSA